MEKWKAFLSKTIFLFFFQGCMKALGVILGDTVTYTSSSVPLVGWSFTAMEGLAFLLAPLASKLMSVMSYRTICVLGGLLNGAGFILEGTFPTSIWLLFVSNLVSGIGFGLLNLPTTIALAEGFGIQFGTALSMCGLVSNTGMVVLPPTLELFRANFGLTGALYLTGALLWNQILCGFLLPSASKRPSAQQSTNDEDDDDDDEYDDDGNEKHRIQEQADDDDVIPSKDLVPKQPNMIVSHPALIPLFASQFFNIVIFMAWSMFLIPFGIYKGYKPSSAVYLSSIGGAGVFLGRTVIVFIFHFKFMSSLPVMITPAVMLPCMLFLGIFLDSFWHISLVSFLMGVCQGTLASWMFAYTKNVVCTYHFKSAIALSSACIGIGVVITGLVCGLIHDIRGSYNDVFAFLAFLGIFQATFMVPAMLLASRNSNCHRGEQQ